MSRAPMDSPEVVGARFTMDCETMGLAPPPFALRARLMRGGEGWSLLLVPPIDAPTGSLVDWLAPTGPTRLDLEPNGVVRAHFALLPEPWSRIFQGVEVEALRLDPDGSAGLSVRGARSKVQRFATRLIELQDRVVVTSLRSAPAVRGILTPLQEEALREAVAAGYYRIPRPLNLHELAQRLGITAASLSERLRRAEARILTKYVEEGVVSKTTERS